MVSLYGYLVLSLCVIPACFPVGCDSLRNSSNFCLRLSPWVIYHCLGRELALPQPTITMTFKAFKEMIDDQAALDAADCAAFNREVATRQGGGDPDMAVTFVAAVPSTPAAVSTDAPWDGYVAF